MLRTANWLAAPNSPIGGQSPATCPLGDAKGGGYLLKTLLTNEFEKQVVLEFAHVDPGGRHVAPVKLQEATDSQS